MREMNEELGPDSTGSLWKRFDTTYRTWNTPRRLATFFVAFVVCTAVVIGVLTVADKASGATADRTSSKICPPHANPDLGCWSNTKAAKKFRQGYFRHTHGFHPKAVFKNPRHFRKIAHAKMVRYLRHHPVVEGKMRQRYLTKRDPGCTDYCLAWKAYGDLMAHSNCSPASPINTDPRTCLPFETSHSKAVARGITLAYCGGTLILGATGVLATDGAATPAVAVGWGSIGCGWGFMASFIN